MFCHQEDLIGLQLNLQSQLELELELETRECVHYKTGNLCKDIIALVHSVQMYCSVVTQVEIHVM